MSTPIATQPAPVDPRADSVLVTMADGIRLATDIYLPQPATARRPAVLVRLPYDKSGRYTFLPEIAARLTAHGFAVVVQDVRGKFRSEGDRIPFVNEAADGAATLDWITAQPWSNGIVGMMGDSYYGFTQWAAASTGHPALRAIVPRVTGSEFYQMFEPGSVPKIPLHEWIVHTFSVPGMLERPYAGLTDGVTRYQIPQEAPHVADLLRDLGNRSAGRSLITPALPTGKPAAHLAIPALHVGGWWDNLQRHQLADWAAAAASPAAAHQFLRMGATDHEDFLLHEDDEPHFDHEVDDDALQPYLDRLMADPIAFLDHYLNERSGPWLAPRVRYEVANLGWYVSDRWTPADTTQVEFALSDAEAATGSAAGGRLAQGAVARPSSSTWKHDPTDPVPFLIASEWGQCANLPDEQRLHTRPDVATFSTEPFERAADIVGRVQMFLNVETSGPSGHIIVRLLDTYPDGRARVILEGASNITSPGGEPKKVMVDLGDTAYRLRPGHSLRLAVSASCFPLYPVHPGTDADLWQPDNQASASYRIHTSPADPSVLRLPLRRPLAQ